MRLKTYHLVFLVFFGVLIPHFLSANFTSGDSRWSIPTSISILREGNTNLDEYRPYIDTFDYRVERIDEHVYTVYPVGVSVLALPVVALAEVIPDSLWNLHLDAVEFGAPRPAEKFAASSIIALAAVFMFLMARLYLEPYPALLIAFIFAYCTSAWSIGSTALWQHGSSMLLLAMALYFLLRAKDNPRYIYPVGFVLAFSFVIRPTNSISIVLMSAYVLLMYPRRLPGFLLGAALVAMPFVLYNEHIYGSWISPYYTPGKVGTDANLDEALIGNLISPSRGLFIFSPVMIFAPVGIWLKIRRREFEKLDTVITMVIFLHWIMISSFNHWWGGHAFGPRYFSDVMPYFVYLLIPVLRYVRKPGVMWVFALTISFSFFVHYHGANSVEALLWDSRPIAVDWARERLWDWDDPSFLRGVFREPPPFYLLENPDLVMEFNRTFPGSGWSEAEYNSNGRSFMWTTSNRSTIEFTFIDNHVPAQLQFYLSQSMSKAVLDSLTVTINDSPIPMRHFRGVSSDAMYIGTIAPAILHDNNRLVIETIELSAATDTDSRTLGAAFDYLEIILLDE